MAFAVTVAVTRIASLGSIVAVTVLPVAAAALGATGVEVAALAGCAVLIVARHRGNIARLVRGDERRIGERAPRAGSPGARGLTTVSGARSGGPGTAAVVDRGLLRPGGERR